jgi:hypothetical protein
MQGTQLQIPPEVFTADIRKVFGLTLEFRRGAVSKTTLSEITLSHAAPQQKASQHRRPFQTITGIDFPLHLVGIEECDALLLLVMEE